MFSAVCSGRDGHDGRTATDGSSRAWSAPWGARTWTAWIAAWAMLAMCATLVESAAADSGSGTTPPGPAPDDPPFVDEPAPGTTIVHPEDRAIMVWVPSGWFWMGMDADEAQAHAESLGYEHYHDIAAEEWFPRRRVYVSGFFVDKYEVTNERWAPFDAWAKENDPEIGRRLLPEEYEGQWALFPARSIYWHEARRYANWASKSLPTEAQWEKAARGTDGRIYPWGNEPLSEERGVFVDLETDRATGAQMVGSKPAGASPYGAMDMAGNLYEWTSEWHEPYPNNPEADRIISYLGHRSGCLRGGSFYHSAHAYSTTKRFGFRPDVSYFHVGFRTVWEPPADYFQSEAFEQARQAVPEREAEIERLRELGSETSPPSRLRISE